MVLLHPYCVIKYAAINVHRSAPPQGMNWSNQVHCVYMISSSHVATYHWIHDLILHTQQSNSIAPVQLSVFLPVSGCSCSIHSPSAKHHKDNYVNSESIVIELLTLYHYVRLITLSNITLNFEQSSQFNTTF